MKLDESERLSLDIVSNLTDDLKKIDQKSPDKGLVDRVCEFINEISEKDCGVWGLSQYEKMGEVLFSFLNEFVV